jgi:aryl-alcohol dehydrogenase-like predicted oxidoreductase
MRTRTVGPFEVSAIGLGCMGLSHGYGPAAPPERAAEVLIGALDAGYTFFDTAALYGMGHNEKLLGEVLGPRLHPGLQMRPQPERQARAERSAGDPQGHLRGEPA